MKIDGYNLLCEIFDVHRDEKVYKSFPIMSLSIYKEDKLTTRRYLTARLSITSRKLVIDHLSTINPVPLFVDRESTVQTILRILWKPMKAFDIPYQYLDSIEYDPETKSLRINTLKEKVSVFLKFRDTKRTSKEIVDLVNKITRK